MRTVGLAILLVAAGLTGCLGDEPAVERSPADGTDEGGPAEPVFASAVNVSKQHPGAEPVVDVASDGTIFVQGQGFEEEPGLTAYAYPGEQTQSRVWRSTDGGESWTDVSPPGRGRNSSCDAYLAVAPDDTVYAANCFIVSYPAPAEMALYRSDDLGSTWTELTDPPFPPDVHRMWLVPEGESTLHVAVESQYPAGGLSYLVSHDRGETWQGPFPVDPDTFWGSELAVDSERDIIYAARLAHEADPSDQEDGTKHTGPFYLRISDDGGRTWERRPIAELEGPIATQAWQPLTVDPAGTLYLVWAEGEEGRAVVHYAFSTDQGQSWEGPVALTSIPGTQTLVWAQARGSGELGISYYHAEEAGLPGQMDASWYAGYALVGQADTGQPTVQTARVTDWAVHEGGICTEGPSCSEETEDRSLLEFTGVAFGPEDRAHTVFASTKWDGYHGFPLFGREQISGAAGSPGPEQVRDGPGLDAAGPLIPR